MAKFHIGHEGVRINPQVVVIILNNIVDGMNDCKNFSRERILSAKVHCKTMDNVALESLKIAPQDPIGVFPLDEPSILTLRKPSWGGIQKIVRTSLCFQGCA